MTDDIHSCSYYCDLPQCIKRQRDELRDQIDHALAARDNVRRELDDLRDKYMDELVAGAQLTKKCDELREKLSVEESLVREWHDRYTTQVMTSEKLIVERDAWRKLVLEHNARRYWEDSKIVIPPELEQP